MAYKVIILYRLYMPSYFLGTFTEYPLLGMVLHGGTYGYNVVSKLLTPKSLKDLHDIGQSIIDQVESERDMATYEKELLTRLNPEELAFFKELRSAESKK